MSPHGRGSQVLEPPPGLAQARRAAGLNQKDLARRLGVRVWEVEELETGRRDVDPYVADLEEHLGDRSEWLRPEQQQAPVATQEGESWRAIIRTSLFDTPWQVRLVLGSFAALVLIRLFTEVVPIVPRLANVIDVLILPVLVVAAVTVRGGERGAELSRWLVPLGALFLVWCVLATVTNLSRVEIGPALVTVYGILSPLAVYLAVYRLWTPGYARSATRLIIVLGGVQILVVGLLQLPGFLTSSEPNPDDLGGTFGTNPYQLVFFLLVVIATAAAVYTWERRSIAARFAPPLIAGSFALIILAQYRSLLFTSLLALVLVTFILRRAGGRGMTAGVGAVAALFAAIALGAQYIPILKLPETFRLDPTEVVSGRVQILDQLDSLYSDEPRFIVTGTGPGTYSSRGWQTFALADSDSRSNVVGPYVLALTGGKTYRTDVSTRYLGTAFENVESVSGSYAVELPFSSYVSTAAEVGVPGVVLLVAIYGIALVTVGGRAWRYSQLQPRGDPIAALLVAAAMAMFVLVQMGLLQNWLEVTRLTFLTWGLVAIASKEYEARADRAGRTA